MKTDFYEAYWDCVAACKQYHPRASRYEILRTLLRVWGER